MSLIPPWCVPPDHSGVGNLRPCRANHAADHCAGADGCYSRSYADREAAIANTPETTFRIAGLTKPFTAQERASIATLDEMVADRILAAQE